MSLSGKFDPKVTRDFIIENAAEIAGVLDSEGGSLTPLQYSRMTGYLNAMISSWEADEIYIWCRRVLGVILEPGKASYTFADDLSGDSHAFYGTLISTTFSSGTGTSISVASTTGMASGDYIGIQLTDDTYHWTTISSVDSSTALTLTTGSSGTYESSGKVYSHTYKPVRPLRIKDGYVRQSAGNDTPTKILSKEEYYRFGIKTTQGLTTQIFYDALWPAGILYCYPVVNTVGNIVYFESHFPFQVFTDSADTPDFPKEWTNALIYGLAVEIGYRYGLDEKRLTKVEQMAKYWRDLAGGMSQENSLYLQPDTTYSLR